MIPLYRLLVVCLLFLMTACAHTNSPRDSDVDAGESHRLRNTMIAVGAALVIGVIVANQTESTVRDALSVPDSN